MKISLKYNGCLFIASNLIVETDLFPVPCCITTVPLGTFRSMSYFDNIIYLYIIDNISLVNMVKNEDM